MKDVTVRMMNDGEEALVSRVALRVVADSGAEGYTKEGIALLVHGLSPESLAEQAGAEGSLFVVAERTGELIGAIALREANQINIFAVESAYQRKGVGAALLKYLCAEVKNLFPMVHEIYFNAPISLRLACEAMGFRSMGKEVVTHGMVSVRMRKRI